MGIASEAFARVFSIGKDVLSVAADAVTGVFLAQTGDSVQGSVESNASEWWQHVGFASRPSPPATGASGCQALAIRGTNGDIVFATRDTRCTSILGNLKDGETCIYGSGSDGNAQGRVLIKQDGSVTMLTTSDNTATGTQVSLRIGPAGLAFTAPWGTWTFDQTGWHITTAGGTALDMADVGGFPGPLAQLGSMCTITAGTIQANGQCLLGPALGVPPYQSVAYGLNASPLTQPLVPILGVPTAFPTGLFVSNSVKVSG